MFSKEMINIASAGILFFSTTFPAYGFVEPSCNDREMARLQASVASTNLANLYTTRTPEGGAYKRKVVVRLRDGRCEIQSVGAFRVIHEPGHPDADTEGFVHYPDISASEEQKHLSQAKRKIEKVPAYFFH